MIKFEKTEVFNFEGAIRGMRNPLNSWDKSDSYLCNEDCPHVMNGTEYVECHNGDYEFCIGKNDLNLAQRLIKAGTDHRKFLRQIMVSVDITAPLYWWKEFDTYKVGTVANSCSTMHKIHAKEFELADFSTEHLTKGAIDAGLKPVIRVLNVARECYINFDILNEDPKGWEKEITCKKDLWWQLIQLLPSSYNQKRTVTLNYEVLRNIYKSRKNHKLDEWSIGFMEWIESLPYAKELIID